MQMSEIKRYEHAFGPSNYIEYLGGHAFVVVNTMALDSDVVDEDVKAQATEYVQIVLFGSRQRMTTLTSDSVYATKLASFLNSVDTNALRARTANGSVVLLTHLPLYRTDDMLCGAARAREEGHVTYEHPSFTYAPHHHVLSPQLSDALLVKFDPHVVLSGHTHAWCETSKRHWNGAKEFTIPAFSWGQRPDPSYALLGLRRQEPRRQRVDHSNPAVEGARLEVATVVPCSVPSEHSIFALYIVTATAFILMNLRRWCLQWRARTQRSQAMKQA